MFLFDLCSIFVDFWSVAGRFLIKIRSSGGLGSKECPKTWRPGFQGPGTGCRGFDTPVGRWPGELLYIDVIVQSNFRLASVARFQNIFGLVYDEDEDDDDGDHDHFCFIAHYPP